MILDLRVYGYPIAQGRPRAFKLPSGQIRVYDPEKSKSWKGDVKTQVLEKLAVTRDGHLAEGPLEVYLGFKLPRPKRARKRDVYPTKRPDIENLSRGVVDAMQGVVFRDDAQIVRLVLAKDYDPQPGVVIRVSTMKEG